MSKCKLSILMCTYNSSATLRRAIDSCLMQTCADWELLVLDNCSEDECVSIVEEYACGDDRIKLFSSDKNIGWAQGVKELLGFAAGGYMCFLAADDYFVNNRAFSYIGDVSESEGMPDVVFVKHVTVMDNSPTALYNDQRLSYFVMKSDDSIWKLRWAAENVYYNSMFHFERIAFLKENGIDFYEPYYADNGGMTEAVLRANTYCVICNPVYALTSDTSKTRGRVIWEEPFGVMRWKSICCSIEEIGAYDEKNLSFLANRFLRLDYNVLKMLCYGAETRDKEMNPIYKDSKDRLSYCEELLSSDAFNQLCLFAGRVDERDGFVESLAWICLQTDKAGWLSDIMNGLYETDGDDVCIKETFSASDVEVVCRGLLNPQNRYLFGFDMLFRIQDRIDDARLLAIVRKYGDTRVMHIRWLMKMAMVIGETGHRDAEVAHIKEKCGSMLDEVRVYFDENELVELDRMIGGIED